MCFVSSCSATLKTSLSCAINLRCNHRNEYRERIHLKVNTCNSLLNNRKTNVKSTLRKKLSTKTVVDIAPSLKYIIPIVWSYKKLDIWSTTIFTIEFQNNFWISVLIFVVYIFCDPGIPARPVFVDFLLKFRLQGVCAVSRRNQTMSDYNWIIIMKRNIGLNFRIPRN